MGQLVCTRIAHVFLRHRPLYVLALVVFPFQSPSPYIWLSSFLSSLFLLYHFQQSRGKKSVLQEGDRQRLISNLASRAIEAHKQSSASGCLNNNLPKSESNITYLSDANPLTTQNPLYVEGVGQTPSNLNLTWKSKLILDKPTPRRRALKDSLLQLNSEGIHRPWTLPTCFAKRHVYDVLNRPVIMDPIQCQRKCTQFGYETLDSSQSTDCPRQLLEKCANNKLTVKEQARQFELNALQEIKQGKPCEIKGIHSLNNMGYNQDCTEKNTNPLIALSCYSSPPSSSPPPSSTSQVLFDAHGPESSVFPSIVITPSDDCNDISPPPTRKPTPPSERKHGVLSDQTCLSVEKMLETHIPDPPNIPPPLPPHLPSSLSNLTSSEPDPTSSYNPPPPPALRAPSPPPSLPIQPLASSSSFPVPIPDPSSPTTMPPPPSLPAAPPLPQKMLISSNFHNSFHSLTSIPLSTARDKLSPLKMPPPEASHPDVGPRRELKGILRHINNLADIEKSVANMYSQIDKSNAVTKQTPKARSLVEVENQNAETLPGHEKQNGNLSCIVEELEKRFPSQSTAL
ncbi:protocadherin-15-like [Rhinophrynus dorsalis]